MRSRYKTITTSNIYFVTSTIINWIPVFNSKKYYSILIDSIKFSQDNMKLKLHAYVFLDNHFHLLISGENITEIMTSIKRYTAKKIIDELQRENNSSILKVFEMYKKHYKKNSRYQIWQEGFHPQAILNDITLNQKIEYIHFNPVKKGLVDNPTEWEYSSACDYYLAKKGILEIEKL